MVEESQRDSFQRNEMNFQVSMQYLNNMYVPDIVD